MLALIVIAVLVLYFTVLYKLQIVEGAAAFENSKNSVVTEQTVTAARGNIYDRYGRILVANRTCTNLLIDYDELFKQEDPNAVILLLAEMVAEFGGSHIDELPVTKEAPFEFIPNMSSIQRVRLDAYLKDKYLDETTTAVELMAYMRSRYSIDNNYTSEQTRIIAGIRYEINTRYIINTSDYIFASDVGIDLITTLLERNISAIKTDVSYIREYKTNYGAHLLGYVGMINSEEYAALSDQGYPLNALTGKDGAEKAFESYLHGQDGTAIRISTATGTVTNTLYTKEPVPGNHIKLTIDIGLQEAAERSLETYITQTNRDREVQNAEARLYGRTKDLLDDITGGAVCAVDVKTGEPLCIASYPNYDPSDVLNNFASLADDWRGPLFNRALLGAYAPGSTFKPVSALAYLDQRICALTSTVKCEGIFTKYERVGYAPTCWIYGEGLHGDLTVTGAIENSCNYFFYTYGDLLGIDLLEKYGRRFGLGEPTGIELPESIGIMANQIQHEEITGLPWYNGDTLQAAIGQSDNLFTPLQLANYAATLSNGGTRHSVSLLKSVRTYDYSHKLYEREPIVADTVYISDAYYKAVWDGMRAVTTSQFSAVTYVFRNSNYTVAAKTGTAQVKDKVTNNAAFICFAPVDDPKIAIAVVIEKGDTGSSIASIAKDVLDYYFRFDNYTTSSDTERELIK